MAEAHEHHVSSLTEYLAVFGALMAGTALTVWVAFVDLGALNNLIALTIAVIKGTLVVAYFMHVKYSSRLTWVFAGAGFVWLVILIGIVLSDYMSRGWIQTPMSPFLR